MTAQWRSLFTKSSFSCLDKRQDFLFEDHATSLRSKNISSHLERQKEFLMGRVCAAKAFKECTGDELLELEANADRSPAWPVNVVGSISHNKNWAGAAVARASDLIGIGIDFEIIGRAKPEISSHIRSESDLKSLPGMSEEELLTLIFSSKESLYKALYPIIKKFFGFQDAALKEVNIERGDFVIVLLTDLSESFGPRARHVFHGRFAVIEETCLTVLEIA